MQLANTGTLAGDLSLAQLDIQDITGGSSVPVFSGQLGVLGTRPLGSIGAVVVQVKLTASPAAGGPSRAYTRKVFVRRPKPRRG